MKLKNREIKPAKGAERGGEMNGSGAGGREGGVRAAIAALPLT